MLVLLLALLMVLVQATSANAQISVSIGFHMSTYPSLVLVPGYPVYYAPRASANYFFYDGLYWVYSRDNWYASSWYDGPWDLVEPEYVPLFLLRVPVRYYRRPPVYFRTWRADGAPRWGEHWGRYWEERRGGWDRWDRRSVPSAAPLPVYQRQYAGRRYPRVVEQQQTIRSQNYGYQPREAVTQQRFAQPPSQIRQNRAAPPVQVQQSRPAPPVQARENRAVPKNRGQERKIEPLPPVRHNRAAPPPQVRENRAAPPMQTREERVAPRNRGQEKKAAPPMQARENRAAPPPQVRENRAAPSNRGQEKKAAKPEKDRGKKGDRGGQEPR